MTRRPGTLRRLRYDESGQLLLLILGYATIGALLVTLAADVSKVFLYRRALAAAADGAALAAAQQLDVGAFYSGAGPSDAVPLSQEGVDGAVGRYVAGNRVDRRFDGFDGQAHTDGRTVTVVFVASVKLPFLHLLDPKYADGYPIRVTANARAPIAGP